MTSVISSRYAIGATLLNVMEEFSMLEIMVAEQGREKMLAEERVISIVFQVKASELP